MKSKKTTTAKPATRTKADHFWSLETSVHDVQRRLRLMQTLINAHFSLDAEPADDLMANFDDIVKACLIDMAAISKAPADVLNWSPEKGR
jgi:hypothetical protein